MRSKIPYFGAFGAKNSKTTWWKFLVLIYFYLTDERNIFSNFKTLCRQDSELCYFFHKFKVALKLTYIFFLKKNGYIVCFVYQIYRKKISPSSI